MLEEDRKIYDQLEPPKTIVVRYGYQKLVAELPYNGDAKPGCGSSLVIRTQRGVELAKMLTTTCPNSGCSKAISRKQMLQYISRSGGRDFPFTEQGKVLRVATRDDVNEQARLDFRKPEIIKHAKALVEEIGLEMKLIELEALLGGERIIFYYTSEHWVDFRQLVKRLASEYQTRIEMHQVNAREEARLVADYERCGQYCCCKNFLKVLKPISMRSAKVQKATLDPQKISGRCGRLMCCLRYEDNTYEQLRKQLPPKKSLVETEDGIGVVLSTQILTQLVLVRIGEDNPAAFPMENIRVLSREEATQFRARQKSGQNSIQQQERRPKTARQSQSAPPAAKQRQQAVDQKPVKEQPLSPQTSGEQPSDHNPQGSGKGSNHQDEASQGTQAPDQSDSKRRQGHRGGRKRHRRRRG